MECESKTDRSAVSFGFSKKSETKVIKQNDGNDIKRKTEEPDFISSLEDQQVNSVKPKEVKKELIIPLIKTNNWKTKHANKTSTDKPPPGDTLESLAVNELVQDAVKRMDDWEERGTVDRGLEVPLLMKNQVPEGYETEDRLDVSLRPDEPEDTDYDEIPIEAFGIAMLRGMGWKPGQGIGKNNKSIAPVEAVLRPKGMGLGADRKQAQHLNNSKQGGNSNKDQDEEHVSMKKGAHCLIEKGPHKDLYGVIEGLDEDNARLMVKLTVSGKSITVSQYNTKLVSSKEYNKYSKYINKGSADRYKEKEDRQKKREKKERSREVDSDRESTHRKTEDRLHGDDGRHADRHERKKDKYRDRDRESDKSSRKRKHKDESSHSSTNGSTHLSHRSLWVRSKLRVRIIDEHYKKGKYYNTKVVIVDVSDKDHCVCRTDEGKVLEDISQSMLETLVPKSDSSYVCIVSGKHRGQIAHVLERDKKKSVSLLQLLSDRDKVVELDYDAICEYVGDVDEEFDF